MQNQLLKWNLTVTYSFLIIIRDVYQHIYNEHRCNVVETDLFDTWCMLLIINCNCAMKLLIALRWPNVPNQNKNATTHN